MTPLEANADNDIYEFKTYIVPLRAWRYDLYIILLCFYAIAQ